MRYTYEWEKPANTNAVLSNIQRLRAETKRISNVTLRGSFAKDEDRQYWEDRLKQLNSELDALERSECSLTTQEIDK